MPARLCNESAHHLQSGSDPAAIGREETRKVRKSHRDSANIKKIMTKTMLILNQVIIQVKFSDPSFLMLNKNIPNFRWNNSDIQCLLMFITTYFFQLDFVSHFCHSYYTNNANSRYYTLFSPVTIQLNSDCILFMHISCSSTFKRNKELVA